MKYLVEVNPDNRRANEIEEKNGFAPMVSYINEHYKPECVYVNPTARQLFLIVDLANETDCCELSTWFARGTLSTPKLTPLAMPSIMTKALDAVKRSPTI